MQLYYHSVGNGPPLVLLHGLFGSADNWQTFAKHMATRYQVLCVDLRNHGRSPHTDTHRYADMADDLYAWLETLGLAQVHLLGHSMGGKVAMTFASRYPARVHRLIVVDMAMRAYPPTYLPHIEAMLALEMTQFSSRREIDLALQPAIPHTQVRQFLLTNVVKQDAHYAWRLNLTTLKRAYPDIQAAVCADTHYHQPALFVHGAHSDYLLPADQVAIRHHFTQAQFIALATGHWVHAEAPDAFANAVHQFLSA